MASDLQLLRSKYQDRLQNISNNSNRCLIVMSGLPGTGKSYLAQKVSNHLDYMVISSDAVRKTLVPKPKYTSSEHYRVFRACHAFIEEQLDSGVGVIFDATNLNSHAINPLRKIALLNESAIIVIRCEAPEDVIKSRLLERTKGKDDFGSDADWRVYQMLRPNKRLIENCDYTVDSSHDTEWLLEKLSGHIGR